MSGPDIVKKDASRTNNTELRQKPNGAEGKKTVQTWKKWEEPSERKLLSMEILHMRTDILQNEVVLNSHQDRAYPIVAAAEPASRPRTTRPGQFDRQTEHTIEQEMEEADVSPEEETEGEGKSTQI